MLSESYTNASKTFHAYASCWRLLNSQPPAAISKPLPGKHWRFAASYYSVVLPASRIILLNTVPMHLWAWHGSCSHHKCMHLHLLQVVSKLARNMLIPERACLQTDTLSEASLQDHDAGLLHTASYSILLRWPIVIFHRERFSSNVHSWLPVNSLSALHSSLSLATLFCDIVRNSIITSTLYVTA